jgi:hypothetical protein
MAEDTVETTKPKPKTTRKPTAGNTLAFFLVTVLTTLLPIAAAGGLFLFIFAEYNFWQYDRTLMVVLFGIIVTIMAAVLSVVLDTVLAPLRARYASRGIKMSANPLTRLVVLVLGGIVLPISIILIANFYVWPEGRTAMDYAIAMAARPVTVAPPVEVGRLALRTQNPSTKILSIQVLQGFHSQEALEQLIRLASEDRQGMQNRAVRDTLSDAIAFYGADAKSYLLAMFHSIDPEQVSPPSAAGGDYYERYFSQSFDSLTNEIGSASQDPAGDETRLAQLAAAQAQLKEALADIENSAITSAADPRQDFILKTFLKMDLAQDEQLLNFAHTTAADTRYSSQVRGDSLLLVAKLGSQTDMEPLYAYLTSSDTFLQARALQAISVLQEKTGQSR